MEKIIITMEHLELIIVVNHPATHLPIRLSKSLTVRNFKTFGEVMF